MEKDIETLKGFCKNCEGKQEVLTHKVYTEKAKNCKRDSHTNKNLPSLAQFKLKV